MRVLITLDRYDGALGQSREINLEALNTRELMFAMMGGEVCGFTVTKMASPEKLMREVDKLSTSQVRPG